MIESLRIIGLCIGVSVIYGIIHDQVTARICIEYFTIAHPNHLDSESPTLQGLYWGVVATWWVGVFMGIPLAFAAQWGKAPRLKANALHYKLLALFLATGASAFAAGLFAFYLANIGFFKLSPPWSIRIDESSHVRFLTTAWIHNTSYLVGVVGGVALVFHTIRQRKSHAS